MESHTSEVIRVRGQPFDDYKLLPQIEWIDTPGKGDTRGEQKDVELWNQTMTELVSFQDHHIDIILWVVNSAWQRGTSLREMMFHELRRSFGINLYKHLSIVFNFLPKTNNKTMDQAEVLSQKEKFLAWIMSMEDKTFQWNGRLRQSVESEVKSLQLYGVDINPRDYTKKPAFLPLSAPYLDKIPPFSHPVGLDSLLDLFQAARMKTQGVNYTALQVDDPHPRVGPGQAFSAMPGPSMCGFRAETPYPSSLPLLVPGIKQLQVDISGTELSRDDRCMLMRHSDVCGDVNNQLPADWKRFRGEPQDVSESGSAAVFLLPPATPAVGMTGKQEGDEGKQKLCFCEAPNCDQLWRFGQSVELSKPPGKCPPLFEKLDISEIRNQFILVQYNASRLIGIPKSSKANGFPVIDIEEDPSLWATPRLWAMRPEMYKDKDVSPKGWYQAVVAHESIYAVNEHAEQLLQLDPSLLTQKVFSHSSCRPCRSQMKLL